MKLLDDRVSQAAHLGVVGFNVPGVLLLLPNIIEALAGPRREQFRQWQLICFVAVKLLSQKKTEPVATPNRQVATSFQNSRPFESCFWFRSQFEVLFLTINNP